MVVVGQVQTRTYKGDGIGFARQSLIQRRTGLMPRPVSEGVNETREGSCLLPEAQACMIALPLLGTRALPGVAAGPLLCNPL
jgi:hypothetical protein